MWPPGEKAESREGMQIQGLRERLPSGVKHCAAVMPTGLLFFWLIFDQVFIGACLHNG